MLPKKHRLPLRTELVRLQEKGKLFQGRLFSLLVSQKPPGSIRDRKKQTIPDRSSRFSFIISTKIHKRATKRNRARRLLAEAIRSLLPKIEPGFDGVFLAKKALIGKELVEIKKEVEGIFRRAGLIMQ